MGDARNTEEARLLAAFRDLDTVRQAEILHALELQAQANNLAKRVATQPDAVELDLIDKLALAISKRSTPRISLEIDLWDMAMIAAYLKRDPKVVRERMACLPSFPKAIRLPTTTGRAQPLYKAIEVIAWAEKQKEKN
ncbi:hypothetical protein ACHMW6_15410 [Pseudoduganella sp. UC29_106]